MESDPYCIACGGLVGFEDVYGRRSRTCIIDDIQLDFRNPLEWGGIYRSGLSSVLHRFRLDNDSLRLLLPLF